MRRRLVALPLAAVLLVGTAACGDETADSGEVSTGSGGVTVTGDPGTAPEVEVDEDFDVSETDSETLVTGDGAAVEADGSALMNLVIYNGSTGDQVFSSYDEGGKPELVTLTEGKFLDALVEPLTGATEGSRVLVTSTVEEGIGADGASQIGLEADQDVIFVIDVLAVAQQPEGDAADLTEGLPAIEEDEDGKVTGIDFTDAAKEPSDELVVETVIEGDGTEITKGATVAVNYYGVVYGEDKPFDESYSRGPASFPVGTGGLIQGWDEGLIGVKAGSRVLMVVPADKGYGEKGSPPNIPANATLVFVIDVLAVAPAEAGAAE